jgi:hypothetical protein
MSAPPTPLNPADEVVILTAPRLPRLWLRVEFTIAPGTDATRAALDAARFVSRTCELDRRLRMALDTEKSGAGGGELVLVFVLGRWGTLEAQWVEEAKPRVRELAADFGGELKSVEVVAE